jgi:hypothetical protein
LARIKLKISYEAARRKVSFLQLWVDAIYRAYIDLRCHGDRKRAGLLNESTDSEREMFLSLRNTSPKYDIKSSAAFRTMFGTGGLIYDDMKGFQKLRALRIRLKLNLKKLKEHLEAKKNYQLDISKVMPPEMKTLNLPISY